MALTNIKALIPGYTLTIVNEQQAWIRATAYFLPTFRTNSLWWKIIEFLE